MTTSTTMFLSKMLTIITILSLILTLCSSTIIRRQQHQQTITTNTVTRANLCTGGHFRSPTGLCKKCPPGTYRLPNSKTNRCESCKAGTFQPFYGVSRSYLCRACYPGTFTGKSGSSKCSTCPNMKTSGFGSTSCTRCAPGYQVSFTGSKCEPCGAKSYSSTFNARQCDLCINGKVSAKRTQCLTCQPGDECYKCPGGMFRNSKTNECEHCPMGETTRYEYNTATKCTPCQKGFFKGKYDYDCSECPNGVKGAPGRGAMECKTGNFKCPEKFFISGKTNVCITCTKGQYRNQKTNTCETCPAGSISVGGGNSFSCTKCSKISGAFPSVDKSECTCMNGLHIVKGKCVKCAAGKYRNNEQHLGSFGCESCKPGWVSGSGAAKCTRCDYGTVANKAATKCVTCGKNEVPNVLSGIDLYYEYGQTRCINGENGYGQGSVPRFYH